MAHLYQALIKPLICAFAMQIMIMLLREQARPEIPDLNTLPGPHWSGVEGFVDIMKVRYMASFATSCYNT